MRLTVAQIIAAIIEREGGYSNRAADRGGPTNRGITQKVLSDWRGRQVSAEEVQALTVEEATAIYKRRYVEEPGFDRLQAEEIRDDVVDAGVNHGTGTAAKWLQEIAGVPVDGVLGPKSLAAINALPPRFVAAMFCARRTRFYGALIAADARKVWDQNKIHTQGENAGGWFNRVAEFIEQLGEAGHGPVA